jgi:hypothetical protein
MLSDSAVADSHHLVLSESKRDGANQAVEWMSLGPDVTLTAMLRPGHHEISVLFFPPIGVT